jgi:serine/threonine protein kinase
MKSRALIGAKYKIKNKIGGGAFGVVYKAINSSDDHEYAIKLEPADAKYPQLSQEARRMKKLNSEIGIPKVYEVGSQGNVTFMVMDLLGPSLEECFNKYSRNFSLKTVLQIGIQLIQRLEFIHEHKVIHRDIKPENILTGRRRYAHILYLIDYGLSKKYRVSGTNQHIAFRDKKNLTGTARYASINSHLGYELSRRDDIESFVYILIYFAKGNLPWQGVQTNVKDSHYKQILEIKMNLSPSVLCRGLPSEFEVLIRYSRSLRFEEKPDYNFIMKKLVEVAKRGQFVLDNIFPWTKLRSFSKTLSTSEVFSLNYQTLNRLKPKSRSAAVKRRISSMELLNKTEEITCSEQPELSISINAAPTERGVKNYPTFQDRDKIFKAVNELKSISVAHQVKSKEQSCQVF